MISKWYQYQVSPSRGVTASFQKLLKTHLGLLQFEPSVTRKDDL